MNEDFVTYELAKRLKEKGYPQRNFGEYNMHAAIAGVKYVLDNLI